jgi:hypothetical protein
MGLRKRQVSQQQQSLDQLLGRLLAVIRLGGQRRRDGIKAKPSEPEVFTDYRQPSRHDETTITG